MDLGSVLAETGQRFDDTIGEDGRVSRETLGGAEGVLGRDDVVRSVLVMWLSVNTHAKLAPVLAPWIAAQDRRTPLPLLWSMDAVGELDGTAAGAQLVAYRREAAVLFKAIIEPMLSSRAAFILPNLTLAQVGCRLSLVV